MCNDAEAVARRACQRIQQAARHAIVSRGRFNIVLAGGRTPELCYEFLSESTSDWNRWHAYFGDERCLPAGDPLRNSVMAAAALFDRVAIPGTQIYPIPAELGAELAAHSYRKTVSNVTPFDMVLLGLGEDGHTASLFPGQHHSGQLEVVPVHGAQKPPPERVSLNVRTLSNSRQVLFLIAGENKQDAVARWRRGEPLPATSIRSRGALEVLIDPAAWGSCPLQRNQGSRSGSNPGI